MKKICIVTTRHISYNPRVLKEADAFHAAGYAVTVVTINNHAEQRRFDEELMRSRDWKLSTVDFRRTAGRERQRWLRLSIKQKFFRALSTMTFRYGVAERAVEKSFDQLVALAAAEKADLYIAHHAEALGVGYRAALRKKALFGFDGEDFHTGMDESGSGFPPERTASLQERMIAYLEAKYLPHARHFTAASSGIAAAYQDKYGLRRPGVILNVFSREDLVATSAHQPVSFYWYSQVIGPNRGLELLLEAAGLVRTTDPAFEIHLRGSLNDQQYRSKLEGLAREKGLAGRLFLHAPILADKLIRDANQYDVGLALETTISFNRDICVTNKVFSYLMSGLFLIGTDTKGQKDIFSQFPAAAVRICKAGDAKDLADAMRFAIRHPEALAEGKKAASRAAAEQFCWDLESRKLLSQVNALLYA